MQILDIARISRKARASLSELYDKRVDGKKVSERVLKALPGEFAHQHARRIIDELMNGLGKDLKLDVLY